MRGSAPSGGVSDASLVGRAAELTRIRAALADARTGSGAALVVEGRAGMGKSRLLAEACRLAGADAMTVLRARCGQSERDLPHGVARRLIEPHLDVVGDAERVGVLGGAAALAGPIFAADPLAVPDDAPGSRFSTLHGGYWVLANLAETKPLLVCVDDAQWCDDPTLRLLLYLAERIENLPVLLLVAMRPRRAADDEALTALRVAHPMSTMPLAPLDLAGVHGVLDPLLAAAPPDVYAACHEVTGGNPFYLHELARSLAEDEAGDLAADRIRELGSSSIARASVLRMLRVGGPGIRLAEALAVLGERTRLRVAARLAGLTDEEAASAADDLAAEGLIDSGPTLDFTHPLIREAVYEQSAPAKRALAHARAAQLLQAMAAPVGRVTDQLLRSPAAGQDWVVDTLRGAGARAHEHGAPETAARFLQRALDEGAPATDRGALLLELGRAEAAAALPGGPAHVAAALEFIHEPGPRADAARLHARTLAAVGDGAAAADVLEQALDTLAPEAEERRAGLLTDYLRSATFVPGLRQRAIARAEPYLRAAPAGTTLDERRLLAALATRSGQTGRPSADTVALAERAWSAGALLRDDGPDGPGWLMVEWALALAEAHDRAHTVGDAALDAARRTGSADAFAAACYFRGHAALHTGALADAQADAEQAVAASVPGRAPHLVPALTLRALALLDRGSIDEAAATVARASELATSGMLEIPWSMHARGRLALARNEPLAAHDLFRRAGHYLRDDLAAEYTVLPWRADAATTALLLGRADEARVLMQEDLRLAERARTPITRGRALRLLGLASGGREGLALLEQAVDALAPTVARLEHARSLADLGAGLRRAGHAVAARPHLRAALELADKCGAAPLGETVRCELAASGTPVPAASARRETITPSQRRVAELAARGMTNSEIAQTLFVTPKTVEYHLRQVFQRLQITGRRQLATALAAATP